MRARPQNPLGEHDLGQDEADCGHNVLASVHSEQDSVCSIAHSRVLGENGVVGRIQVARAESECLEQHDPRQHAPRKECHGRDSDIQPLVVVVFGRELGGALISLQCVQIITFMRCTSAGPGHAGDLA